MRAGRAAVVLLSAIGAALGQPGSSPDRVDTTTVRIGESFAPTCSGCTVSRTYVATTECLFMKVHFANFRLPTGAAVRVCGAHRGGGRRECHSYGAGHDAHTVERNIGEDGVLRFGALSVNGAEATVSLTLPGGVAWGEANGLTVASVTEVGRAVSAARSARALSTCGATSYGDAACYRSQFPTHYAKSMAVAKLYVGFTGKTCTAFRLTRNNLVMTNDHCLSSFEELESAEFHFNFQQQECGGSAGEVPVKVIGSSLLLTDAELDYALIRLTEGGYHQLMLWRGHNGERIGHLELSSQDPVIGSPTRVYIPQHPSGQEKKLAIREDRPSGYCEVPGRVQDLLPPGHNDWADYKLGYRCDTEGGSSGAPVIRASDHAVVALHSTGECEPGPSADPTRTNKGTKASHIRISIAERTPYLRVTDWPTAYPGSVPSPATGLPSTWFPTHWPGVPRPVPTGWPSTGFPQQPPGPTEYPTGFPSAFPTVGPPPTGAPTAQPTGSPRTGFPSTGFPSTGFPSTGFPARTGYPSRSPKPPTGFPSGFPTGFPNCRTQGEWPCTGYPSRWPTGFPTRPPQHPTGFPTKQPIPPSGYPTRTPG